MAGAHAAAGAGGQDSTVRPDEGHLVAVTLGHGIQALRGAVLVPGDDHPGGVARPRQRLDLAERLPKVLIHRNVPGEPIHDLLTRLDRAWETCAGWAPHGPRIRWRRTMAMLAGEGVPLTGPRRPVRDNLFTVPFGYVAPEYEAGFA